MKKINSFNIIGLVVALFVTSTCLTSCSDYSNDLDYNEPQKKVTPSDPTPDPSAPDTPQPTDSDTWANVVRKYYKVFENADVTSTIVGQRDNGNLDSLVLRYKYVYGLAADTTIFLDAAPTSNISFTADVERSWFSEYTINEKGDSVCTISYTKPYTLSNGVPLSLTTQRIRGWHVMGGQPVMYSEPTQTVGRMTISSTTSEFERNDSIFGLRTNICSVPLTLGGVQFTASATIREIWFNRLKDGEEPHFDVFVNEAVSYLAGSMVQIVPSNKWKNVHLMTGANMVHPIVVTTDAHNAKVVSVEDMPVNRSRVIVSKQVNGSLYDPTTGLFVTAALTPDNDGWEGDGVIDGRHVEYSRGHAEMIDEGVKNFMETNTSKPTLTFSGVSAKVTATWGEYEYTTITWTKYSKEGKAYMNTIVVKSPKK